MLQDDVLKTYENRIGIKPYSLALDLEVDIIEYRQAMEPDIMARLNVHRSPYL